MGTQRFATTSTPGPWSYLDDKDTGAEPNLLIVAPWSERVAPGHAENFGDYRGAHICSVPYVPGDAVPNLAQAEANARLIAAAPDLLLSTLTLIDVVEQLIPEPSARCVADIVLTQARSAVLKASGR